jgi:hypothetical protein
MIAYKLFRVRRDGSIGPLFINRNLRIPVGVPLPAEAHRTPKFWLAVYTRKRIDQKRDNRSRSVQMWIVQEFVAGKWFTCKSFSTEAQAQEYAAWTGGRPTRIKHKGKLVTKRVSVLARKE